ncbi:MAG: tRNA pseudouridine(38-40) synthase TruA [Chloroflexi bacterium]|nr:tRNA pseudouridine(38-40) synthase TruA [Chloroflexota bacterium]
MSIHAKEDGHLALEELRRLALLVEYNGAGYHGFQVQRNVKSVQETLEDAIHTLTRERLRIKGAGRTDAGVHAQGQVVAFDTWASYAPGVFVQALNHYLPEDISIKDACQVSLDFDPRRWAISREYRYKILNSATHSPLLQGFVHHVRKPLDAAAMQEAARLLEGERDFAPFSGPLSNGRVNTRRRVFQCSVSRQADMVFLDMVANGFLPQQVRRTAGALAEVGLGRLGLHEFRELAECGKLGAADWVLPAKGLSLVKINYPMLLFSSADIVDGWEHVFLETRAV